jgi:hypothetical protein
VRIVVGGAPDCTAGLVPDITDLPALNGGALATVALLGDALPTPSLQAISLLDGPATKLTDGGMPKIYLRFLHAAPGLKTSTVDMLLDTVGMAPTVAFSGVAFGKTGGAPGGGADAGRDGGPSLQNGYLVKDPCASSLSACPTVAVLPSVGGDAAAPVAAGSFPAAAGSVITLALIGETPATDSGASAAPFQLLECVDNAGLSNTLGSCSVLTH